MGVDVSFLDPSPSEFPSGWFSGRGRVKMSSNIFRSGGQCSAYVRVRIIMTVSVICMTKSDNENAYIMCTYVVVTIYHLSQWRVCVQDFRDISIYLYTYPYARTNTMHRAVGNRISMIHKIKFSNFLLIIFFYIRRYEGQKWLGGKRFTSNKRVIAQTDVYFEDHPKSFFLDN